MTITKTVMAKDVFTESATKTVGIAPIYGPTKGITLVKEIIKAKRKAYGILTKYKLIIAIINKINVSSRVPFTNILKSELISFNKDLGIYLAKKELTFL